MAAQPLLRAGLRKSIRAAQTTLVWSDPWLPATPACPPIPCGPSFNPSLWVSDLIDSRSNEWKHKLLSELIAPDDIPYVRSLKPTRSPRGINYC
ncbi:unnamed protein product [Brassica oleracea]